MIGFDIVEFTKLKEQAMSLVAEIKALPDGPDKSLKQAALVRNRRRAIATTEAMTDFVLVGLAEEGDHHCLALVPELMNHKRALLRPVTLTSDNRKMPREFVDFVLVGDARDVAPPTRSGERQSGR